MAGWFLLLSSAIASTSLLVRSAANNHSEPLDISALLNKLAIHSQCPNQTIPAFLHRFQIGYDRRVRPNYGGPPVTVGVSLYVLSLSEISEKFMDFTFDMYFRYDRLDIIMENSKILISTFARQFWKDDRLRFDPKVKNLFFKI